MAVPDYLVLHAGQEVTVRTGHGIMNWFQIEKGVHQGFTSSPYLFNLHAEYIMQNARLNEAQAGIKIAGRNINNLRYTDDTTLMAEGEEELKRLLMKVKEGRQNPNNITDLTRLLNILTSHLLPGICRWH